MSDTKKSSIPDGHVRKTFDVPEDLARKLRLLSARMNVSETNIVRTLLQESLKNIEC